MLAKIPEETAIEDTTVTPARLSTYRIVEQLLYLVEAAETLRFAADPHALQVALLRAIAEARKLREAMPHG